MPEAVGLAIGVYPRVCGGAFPIGTPVVTGRGLSPRVRGSHRDGGYRRKRSGSIPACAGEPLRRSRCPRESQVYPRVCGGAPPIAPRLPACQGLSPRVRGSRYRKHHTLPRLRSIPACAGSLGPSEEHHFLCGSIPACAGEPLCDVSGGYQQQVYPRVCGGASSMTWAACASRGLSPRVRGSRYAFRSRQHPLGSIPACAGEPPRVCRPFRRTGVYPRVCGGAAGLPVLHRRLCGLSPRVRGSPT